MTPGRRNLKLTHLQRATERKFPKKSLKKVLYSPGDGVVPKRSLVSSLLNIGKLGNLKSGVLEDLTFSCSEHNRLTGDAIISKSLLSVLDIPFSAVPEKTVKSAKSKKPAN